MLIPVHTLAEKIGSTCEVILAVHYLIGTDVTCKVEMKAGTLKAHHEQFLCNLGRNSSVQDVNYEYAEENLMQVVRCGSKCKTFDELHAHSHVKGSNLYLNWLLMGAICPEKLQLSSFTIIVYLN